MRKSELHPRLQASCQPVPDHSGCYAVVPEPVPLAVDAPACHGLFMLARRELEALQETVQVNAAMAQIVFHMLNRREAVDSSQIEGTHTGFDGLLIHEMERNGANAAEDRDAEETLAYVRAFVQGAHRVEREGQAALDLDLLCQLHASLMAGQTRAMPGQRRERQNYIGLRMETAHYIPPPPGEVARLLADLAGLLQYRPDGVKEVSILMRAPIAHAQFEAIHPFLDGNGRTGRLLLPLMFKAAGEPPIHLATFLKLRQREYYDALLRVQTRLQWEPWIKLFLECVIASCRHTVQLFGQLQSIRADWRQTLVAHRKRKHATIWRVADLLLGQPVLTVNEVAARLKVTYPAANDAVAELAELDILRPGNEQRRHRVFHAHQVLNALYTGLDAAIADAAAASAV